MAKVIVGTVISNKMKNTVVVKITTKVKHPLYKKLITKTRKYKVHNEMDLQVGQKVAIAETKPFSKDVHFVVTEVIK